jgi:hypothetical protein
MCQINGVTTTKDEEREAKRVRKEDGPAPLYEPVRIVGCEAEAFH